MSDAFTFGQTVFDAERDAYVTPVVGKVELPNITRLVRMTLTSTGGVGDSAYCMANDPSYMEREP